MRASVTYATVGYRRGVASSGDGPAGRSPVRSRRRSAPSDPGGCDETSLYARLRAPAAPQLDAAAGSRGTSGVILDGNRRWARACGGAATSEGHQAGADKIEELLGWCEEAGVEVVTLWLLSTDNLAARRASSSRCCGSSRTLVERAGRDRPLAGAPGRRARPAARRRPRDALKDAAERDPRRRRACTSTSRSATAVGARSPTRSARCCTSTPPRARSIEELAEVLDVEHIAEHLYTQGQPDPDLVIRTSGEQRLSGFLLWQSAHSEFYFCEAYWPDFRKVDFLRALRSYSQRHRRFGA